ITGVKDEVRVQSEEPFTCFHASLRIPICTLIQQISVKNLPDAFLVFPPHREKMVVRFGVRLVR
ncbi:hypothetical protein, partial [Brenneria corticis]|uniref:hypothetical protein n=1 Tax=Brenneria corticis TaxID=2173106 RepID=UPI001AEF8281